MKAPPDTLLVGAYTALDRYGVRWARLRDEDPEEPFTEVDLLIAPADLDVAAGALAEEGFVGLAGRGLGSHRFYLTYDTGADRWLKLDVVTDLAFGRRRELLAAEAGPVLARRVRTAQGWSLAPTDGFWALALHCLLDRRAVAGRHRTRLAQLAGAAGASPLTETLDDALLDRMIVAAASGDVDRLLGCAGPLRRAMVGTRPAGMTARLTGHAVRALGAKLTVPARPGLVVALLGPDGSGKSTLGAGLRSVLPLRARLLHGGLYAGRQGSLARLVHLARFTLAARYEARRGSVVIADRHPLEIPAHKPGARAALRRRLHGAAPAPDLTLVLDCDGDTMFGRKGEHSPGQLEDQRRRLLALSRRLPRTAMLDARLPRQAVRAGASVAVWDCLRERAPASVQVKDVARTPRRPGDSDTGARHP